MDNRAATPRWTALGLIATALLAAALPLRCAAAPQPLLAAGSRVKLAPCDESKERTCAAKGRQICCNKLNFACGTRADNGEPRCAMCPQTCTVACKPGYLCGRDPADGCFKGIKGTASSSSSRRSKSGGSINRSSGATSMQRACSGGKPCARG